ncbi:MAG: PA14 domain-containing protein, partial [Planctomycetota bacterium]|nr:PA14 domain-containing protein [Planctomycetota bacterium]
NAFKGEYEAQIKHLQGQNYNGKGAPRIVLASPIAFEDHKSPNLPDGKEANERLALYTKAIAEVAAAAKAPYVDLFHKTREAYKSSNRRFTINGIHLNEYGNQQVADMIDRALFPAPEIKLDGNHLEKIRSSVKDKNFYYWHRYRTVDGFSIYGGRSKLHRNFDVMQRELQILDAMTANRDKRIWSIAQGKGDIKIDDSNTPAFIDIASNRKGPNPDGSYKFLSGEEAIKKMHVHEGMKVNLFADEAMYPELVNPVQMAFDTAGRLFVAAWPTYPHWKPKDPMNDKLLMFEDTSGDGQADRMVAFADDIHCPTGFEFWNGGVYVMQQPELLFMKDTDGDGKADYRQRVVGGIDSADTHHSSNSFAMDPGGGLYFNEGIFNMTQIETPYFGRIRTSNGGGYRYEIRTQKMEVWVRHSWPNPHGHAFDYWGQSFMSDGTGSKHYWATPMTGHLDFGKRVRGPKQWLNRRSRPCPATEVLSSRHFPDEHMDNFLIANVIGFQGIFQFKVHDDESGFRGEEVKEILYSDDRSFRPVDLETGPDGALYFTDWQNPLIGHMQHNLRDPNRDKKHGRIYRVTYEGRPLVTPKKIAGESIASLLELLKERELRVLQRTRSELSGRDVSKVIPAAKKWIAGLDKNDAAYEHHMMEGLWLHQSFNVIDEALLARMLRSPDFHARAAATRVLCHWRDQVKDPIALLKVQAVDEHPRVRIEAVRAASFFRNYRAAEVAIASLAKPTDYYIDFTFKQTMLQLEQWWKPAAAEGKLTASSPAAAQFILKNVSTAQLLKMPRNRGVYNALLTRSGVPMDVRKESLEALAKMDNKDSAALLIETLDALDSGSIPDASEALESLGKLFSGQTADILRKQLSLLKKMSTQSRTSGMRSLGYASWMKAEGSPDAAWAEASKDGERVRDFLGALPQVDQKLQSAAYALLKPLMAKLPKALAPEGEEDGAVGKPGIAVDYYARYPRSAKREVVEKMKPTASGIADAIDLTTPVLKNKGAFGLRFSGAIIAPVSGTYTFYIKSDDGSMLYLDDKLLINNGGRHGPVEKEGTIRLSSGAHRLLVTMFDSGGGDFLQVYWKGPKMKRSVIAKEYLRTEGGMSLRGEILIAIAELPGQEAEKFREFARLIQAGNQVPAAAAAISRLPKETWPKDAIKPALEGIIKLLESKQGLDRNTASINAAVNLGHELAKAIPDGEPYMTKLLNQAVRRFVVRPVPHQMIYDTKRLTVAAGQPVVITFENIDAMPHNLVVIKPGTLTEVGEAADRMQGPAAEKKGYIPDTPSIMYATSLLLPGASEDLQFLAPTEPGDYVFVCTFPGHYRLMNGILRVVKSVDASTRSQVMIAASDDSPKKASRKFVKMWKVKDLSPEIDIPLTGRDFKTGQRMFNAVGCNKCHKVAGSGKQLGPDLTEVSKKYQGKKLLEQIIDPSTEINEQFKAFTFLTEDDETFVGTVLKEDGKFLHLAASLLDTKKIVKLKKDTIQGKKPLEVSQMPTGLLVTLTKEEILDLVAFIQSGGNSKDRAFKKK